MHWRRSNVLLLAVVSLATLTLGWLVYDAFRLDRESMQHSEQWKLRVPELISLYTVDTRGWIQGMLHPSKSSEHAESLQMQQLHMDLRAIDINISKVGLISARTDRVIAASSMSTALDNSQIPWRKIPRIGQDGKFHSIVLQNGALEQSYVPVYHDGRLAGLIYYVARVDDRQAENLWLLLGVISGLVLILLLSFTVGLRRMFRYLHSEPKRITTWVEALGSDPFVAMPTGLNVLKPLARRILDLRATLHLQEGWLRAVVSATPLSIIHLSANFEVMMVNEITTTLVGLSADNIVGTHLKELAKMLNMDKNSLASIREKLLTHGSVRNVEMEFVHKSSQTLRFMLVSVIPTAIEENTAGYSVFAEDITTKKQWDAYSARNDRLNLIAEFAASTAHEIRNPLTTVRGFLQLQKRRVPEIIGKDHFQIMIDEIDRVDSLITEYLTLARNSATSHRVPTRIDVLLQSLLPLVTAEANLKGIVVCLLALPEGVCLASGQELKQVFLNLVKNAMDAMENGGILTVNATRATTTYSIAISDTGCGIHPEHVDRIFQPFFTTKASGSGLGLAISKKIVESHRGEISAQSMLDEGTTFMVTLPLIDLSA